MDIVVGVWCDRRGVVISFWVGRYSNDVVGGDVINELIRCCCYVVVFVGDFVFMYGGFRGGKLNIFWFCSYFFYVKWEVGWYVYVWFLRVCDY